MEHLIRDDKCRQNWVSTAAFVEGSLTFSSSIYAEEVGFGAKVKIGAHKSIPSPQTISMFVLDEDCHIEEQAQIGCK